MQYRYDQPSHFRPWQHDGATYYQWNGHGYQNMYRQISIEEAMRIAMERVPGEIVKVELDTEQGMIVYEVDIMTPQGIQYEVVVDRNTGRVIEIKLD
ncbi:MAG TPA: PepSY domain-containing protein [Bacillota bacterium]